jgi:carbon-monoxide dehydrogenase large subunit
MTYSPAARHPPDIRLENLDRVPASASRQYPLAVERARFVGEAVAFVVAETLASAKDAAEAVRVVYVPLASVTNSAAAAFEDAPSLLDESGANLLLDAGVGDHEATERGFAAAAHIIRLSTWVQRVTGVPMEPRAALAEFDPASGRITLYAGGGSIGRPRQDVAAMLGLPKDRCGSSPAMSAAISAPGTPPTRNSHSLPGRRAGSAVRSSGPASARRRFSATTRPAISRSRPRSP